MTSIQSQLKPVPLRLYPTMDSISDSIEYAKSHFPEEHWPNLVTVLMVHQNTILSELKKAQDGNVPQA